jgi:hypothetical protein
LSVVVEVVALAMLVAVVVAVSCTQPITVWLRVAPTRSLLAMVVLDMQLQHQAVKEAPGRILSLVGHREQPLSSQMAAVEAILLVEAVAVWIIKHPLRALQHLVRRQELQDLQDLQRWLSTVWLQTWPLMVNQVGWVKGMVYVGRLTMILHAVGVVAVAVEHWLQEQFQQLIHRRNGAQEMVEMVLS